MRYCGLWTIGPLTDTAGSAPKKMGRGVRPLARIRSEL
jgi:hypothetical protein